MYTTTKSLNFISPPLMDQNHLLQNFQSLINMVVFELGLWLSLAKTENYLEQNFPASLTSPGPDLEVCLVCLVCLQISWRQDYENTPDKWLLSPWFYTTVCRGLHCNGVKYCQAQPQLNSTQPELKLRLRLALFPSDPATHPPTHPPTRPPGHPEQ